MSYTVKELAKISGVSVRTLHWYDEIGLLKPAYCGANRFRYYEKEQLLLLQQILFFRELGFKLDDIQKVLESDDFDKVRALQTHRGNLEKNLDHTKGLIETIDKTINHVRGKQKMKDKDLYNGLDAAKKKKLEKYNVKYQRTVAEDIISEKSPKNKDGLDEKEKARIEREGNEICKAIAGCIEKGLTPRCAEVQKLVDIHFHFMSSIHEVNKEVYTAYAQLYWERPEFRKLLNHHHPELAEFLAEAMRVYAHENLS